MKQVFAQECSQWVQVHVVLQELKDLLNFSYCITNWFGNRGCVLPFTSLL